MFCLDVHSRATSLMSTERRGAVSQQEYETLRGEEWQKQKKKKKRVGTVQNGQIPTCCNSSSKTVSQPSPASLYHFAHILVLLLPINTRHASICLYRSAVNFQQHQQTRPASTITYAVQYLMYEPDIRVVLSVLKKGTFLKLVSLGRPSQKLSRFHSKQS